MKAVAAVLGQQAACCFEWTAELKTDRATCSATVAWPCDHERFRAHPAKTPLAASAKRASRPWRDVSWRNGVGASSEDFAMSIFVQLRGSYSIEFHVVARPAPEQKCWHEWCSSLKRGMLEESRTDDLLTCNFVITVSRNRCRSRVRRFPD